MFGFRQNNQNAVKNFYQEVPRLQETETSRLGVQSIQLVDIVGSVGRASELDKNFRFKNQGWNERHQRIETRLRRGAPTEPIKVFKIQKGTVSEYYVVDGHHRVAIAKRNGYLSMNAEITEVRL